MKRFSLKEGSVYAVIFATMLLSRTETLSHLRPFALGLYVALVYSRYNTPLLSLIYVVTGYIVEPDFASLVHNLYASGVICVASFVHFVAKRPPSLLLVNIYALLCQIPDVLYSYSGIWDVVGGVLVTQIYTYCAIISVHALTTRGLRYRMTVDELIATAVLVAGVSLGLYGVEIMGFRPFYGIVCTVLLTAVYVSGNGSIPIAVVVGLGVGLGTGSFGTCALLTVCTTVALAFSSLPRYCTSIVYVIADLVMGAFYGVYVFEWLHAISVLMGAVGFLLVRDSFMVRTKGYLDVIKGRAEKALVLRTRREMSARLIELGAVYRSCAEVLTDGIASDACSEDMRVHLVRELTERLCANCPERSKCEGRFGGNTDAIFQPLVESALRRGKVTVMDLPPYMTGNCVRVTKATVILSDLMRGCVENREREDRRREYRTTIGAELRGICRIVEEMANGIGDRFSFDQTKERVIADELTTRNVICADAVVYFDCGVTKASLILRSTDRDKKTVQKVLSHVLGTRMICENVRTQDRDWCVMDYVAEPRYDMAFGEERYGVDGSANGDSGSIIRVGSSYVMTVCDGMGHGKSAESSSKTSVEMIENLMRAGLSHSTVMDTVNRIMNLKGEESFSTVDMAVVDMNDATVNIVKMGATDGIIRRRDGVEIVSGRGLPVGMVEEVKCATLSKALMEDDMLILMSDGVSDTLGLNAISEFVASCGISNPQKLASVLVGQAREHGSKDDLSVVCGRLFRRL